MIVTLAAGIESVSGTFSKSNGRRIIFTTRKAPTSSKNRVRMYLRSDTSYQRKGELTEREIKARELFARRQAYVQELLASGRYHSKAFAWKIAKKEIM